MIETGKHVKIILRNGAMAEGIVEEWFGNIVKLKSLDEESELIITHPSEDIMLIKVFLKDEKSEAEKIRDRIAATSVTEAEQKLQEFAASHNPNNEDDRKSLAQLRIELINQERKLIAEKLKDHSPSTGPGKVQYGYPGLGKKPRIK